MFLPFEQSLAECLLSDHSEHVYRESQLFSMVKSRASLFSLRRQTGWGTWAKVNPSRKHDHMAMLFCLYLKSWGGRVPIMVVLESWAYLGISSLGCSLKRKCSLEISPFFLLLWRKESIALRMYFRSSSGNSNVQTPKGPGLWLPVSFYALSATATDGYYQKDIIKSF